VGVQSFADQLLTAMNRPHTAAEACNVIKLAQAAGFANISLDLIYGLPGQNLADWQADLEAAIALAPQHISLYGLSLSEQSVWGKAEQAGSLAIAEQDLSADLLEEAIRFLPQAGYQQYEISNFARPGFESRHNTAYWQRNNYLGLGAAASSCAGLERWNNQRDLDVYQACLAQNELPRFEQEQLSIEEVLGEALFLGLRQTKGLNLADYQERYGISPLKYYRRILQRQQKQGLVEVADGYLRLTERGLLLGNEVFEQFV
jgi:oxygen-independent coproporphyrinogen-3 oxidase